MHSGISQINDHLKPFKRYNHKTFQHNKFQSNTKHFRFFFSLPMQSFVMKRFAANSLTPHFLRAIVTQNNSTRLFGNSIRFLSSFFLSLQLQTPALSNEKHWHCRKKRPNSTTTHHAFWWTNPRQSNWITQKMHDICQGLFSICF